MLCDKRSCSAPASQLVRHPFVFLSFRLREVNVHGQQYLVPRQISKNLGLAQGLLNTCLDSQDLPSESDRSSYWCRSRLDDVV